jgi:hypothetical protein
MSLCIDVFKTLALDLGFAVKASWLLSAVPAQARWGCLHYRALTARLIFGNPDGCQTEWP